MPMYSSKEFLTGLATGAAGFGVLVGLKYLITNGTGM